MARESRGGREQDPVMEAEQRWGVDLNDDEAVLQKLAAMRGKLPDVADLSNLWRDNREKQKAA